MAAGVDDGVFDNWPTSAKLMLSLAAAAAWIGVPLIVVWRLMDKTVAMGGVVSYEPMMAVLIAMTTATIAGTFVFMTFRIDRGTRLKAERVARDAAAEALEKIVDTLKKDMDERAEKMVVEARRKICDAVKQRLDDATTSEEICRGIKVRVNDEELRGHVRAVLITKTNIQAINEYVSSEAKHLDAKALGKVIDRFRKVVELWSRHLEKERKRQEKERDRRGFWRKVMAFLRRWKQSPRER